MQLYKQGKVTLVGAGPGDPGLITVKGLACLREADVVLHDRLIPTALLKEAPTAAEIIDVGKKPGCHKHSQWQINALLIAKARQGKRVVRLKGGDPFVFGRGGEECRALEEAGIPFEVVPGVTSAVGVPAYAGIPVTYRGISDTFTVVTGRTNTPIASRDWETLAQSPTLIILMGVNQLAEIVRNLRACGRHPETPVAVIGWGTTPEQVAITGKLTDIVEKADSMNPPATIVIGEVVNLNRQLGWFHPVHSNAENQSAGDVTLAGMTRSSL